MIAAALDGIDNASTPPKALNNVNIYELSKDERVTRGIESLPGSLKDALLELKADDVIKNSIGEKLFSAFFRAKEEEWEDYRIHVTDWEVENYLMGA